MPPDTPRPEPPGSARSGLSPGTLRSPSVQRNRDAICAVLARVLPSRGLVLEVASGTGEHAAWFAPRLPGIRWQPSDPSPQARGSIAAWRDAVQAENLLPPLDLDAGLPHWPVEQAAAVVCINMLHIAPWTAGLGLLRGAGRVLSPGGPLVLYGAYRREGRHTAPSNEAFDQALRRQDPSWGVRDLEEVAARAAEEGLLLDEVVEMPANNLSVIFRRLL